MAPRDLLKQARVAGDQIGFRDQSNAQAGGPREDSEHGPR